MDLRKKGKIHQTVKKKNYLMGPDAHGFEFELGLHFVPQLRRDLSFKHHACYCRLTLYCDSWFNKNKKIVLFII